MALSASTPSFYRLFPDAQMNNSTRLVVTIGRQAVGMRLSYDGR